MKRPTGTKRRKRPAPVATGARAAAAKASRPYTLSAAALAQRRRAAPAGNTASLTTSTGPTSEAGKAASSRNNWRHGQYSAVHRQHRASAEASVALLYGKPCRTTCPVHPDNAERTEAPCSLVVQDLTQAGGNCLDKTRFVQAFDAIMDAIAGDDDAAMKSLMASELAGNFQLVDALKRSIAQDGVLVRLPAFDREGKLVYDHEGHIAYRDIRAHPALPHLAKFLEVLGVSLPEALATPKSRAAKGTADDLTAGLQSLLGGIHQRASEARTVAPRALEQGGSE